MRILRPRDTEAKVGLCDRELRDLEREGLFPKRFPINPSGKGRAVGHLESEVDAWIEARAAPREGRCMKRETPRGWRGVSVIKLAADDLALSLHCPNPQLPALIARHLGRDFLTAFAAGGRCE
jgi:predicted DNA-binding transcriptional regulator AlpA